MGNDLLASIFDFMIKKMKVFDSFSFGFLFKLWEEVLNSVDFEFSSLCDCCE